MRKYKKAILQIIRLSQGHLTAEDVYQLVRAEYPSIALATVYNNLNSLAELQLINKVQLTNLNYHYDKLVHSHGHLICDQCGRIEDLDIGDFIGGLEKQHRIKLGSCEVNLHYICDSCQTGDRK